MESEILVRVKYKNEMKFIPISMVDLTVTQFVHRVARAFKFIVKQGDKAKLYDNLDTPISDATFSNVLKTFHSGSCFFIHVVHDNGSPPIVTPNMLKDFFIEKNAQVLLNQCDTASKNGMNLTDHQKTACVSLIADYGISIFGLNPLPQQYDLLAFAAIDLIKGLKSKSGSPIGILINTTESGKGGRLYNRFRYLRQKNNESQKNKESQEIVTSSASPQNLCQQYTMEDMLYLKTVVVSPDNIAEIRKKLEATRLQRDELVKDPVTDLIIKFPFFFTHPQLITDDFVLKFKHNQKDMNANALIENWPEITQNLKFVLDKYYQKQVFETDWPDDIEWFLILLRLLPFKQGCRSLASTETFHNCVKRLLIFSNTSGDANTGLEKHQNTQPYIIAYGDTKKSITRYSISVDNEYMCIPPEFSFSMVIDLYFKLHHIFEMKFDERLQNAMFFLKHYVYKMKEGAKKPSTKMIDLHNHLLSCNITPSNDQD